jgi:hypothetical protein
MCLEKTSLNEKLAQELLDCEEKKKDLRDDLETWTDALEELSNIEDTFKTSEEFDVDGKTILDIGTDAVKPLYLALKFKPRKIIGISEGLRPYVSNIEQNSKLFTQTKIRLYACSFFDNETFSRILKREKIGKFDFVLVSKTLHHLRSGECIAKERDMKHECSEIQACCMYGFEEQAIFEKLLELGKRVIIYEFFDPSDTDDDKIRGRGGYFTVKEWKRIFEYLFGKYKVEFTRPKRFTLDQETLSNVDSILRQVDVVCFYVEEKI